MDKLIGMLKNLINGDSKVRLVVTGVISIVLVSVLMLGSTYSLFTTSNVDEDLNVYKTGNLDVTYTLSSDNIKLTDSTPTSLDDSVYIEPYRITINNSGNVPYMFDILLTDSTATDVINYEYIMTQVGKLDVRRLSDCTDSIIKEDVIVPAGESVDVDVRVFLSDDIKNTELGKSFYAKLSVDGVAVYNEDDSIDNSVLIADVIYNNNKPNLDSGLVPVYYDDKSEVWKKADSDNSNGNWYDYGAKKWANAVLISDADKRNDYLKADVGSVIKEEDVVGYFVWIPRFKYRVWDINRQSGNEDSYAYSAYTDGIDIKWEKGIRTTDNVDCTYNVNTVITDSSLSDVCVYDDNDTITTSSDNSDYTDVWYTHPAFTSNGKEKSGFWIGKFETTGDLEKAVILPGSYSWKNLTDVDVEELYEASSKFYDYGLTDLSSQNINNLEWGAVTYLTHSVYGVCGEDGCGDVYANNSYYTGMSSGGNTTSGDIKIKGNYNYKGYSVDLDSGKVLDNKDITKIASTTGNITGVYDMSGGASEIILGKMIDTDTKIESNIENYYTYGVSSSDRQAYNRMKLGDATAEIVGVFKNEGKVVSEDDALYSFWLRGGNLGSSTIFDFDRYTGTWNDGVGAVSGRTILK